MTPPITKTAERRLLGILLAAYLFLGIGYSVITPIFEASDELWHYPMVKYLADHGLALPPQEVGVTTAWRQEGSQPPLYYMLAAVLTGGIDSADLDLVRRQNPHADIGVVRPDGNVNMIVHRADREAFPWRGAVLAVHVARLFSVALGLGTIWVTWRLGAALFAGALTASYYPPLHGATDFWTTSASFFFARVGLMLVALGAAHAWLDGRPVTWTPLLQFGRTSLFVYWIHVELAYGVLASPVKGMLPLGWAYVGFVLFTVAMLAASVAKDRLVAQWRSPITTVAQGA